MWSLVAIDIPSPSGQQNEDLRRKISTLVHSLSKYEIPCVTKDCDDDSDGNGDEESNFELKGVETLLRQVRQKHMALVDSYSPQVDPQHPHLHHRLRKYQCEAVRWMMFKEAEEYIAEGRRSLCHFFLPDYEI